MDADNRKRNGRAGIAPSQRRLYVFDCLCLALRDGTPTIEIRMSGRGSSKVIDMTEFERLEAHLLAVQDRILRGHASTMQ